VLPRESKRNLKMDTDCSQLVLLADSVTTAGLEPERTAGAARRRVCGENRTRRGGQAPLPRDAWGRDDDDEHC
jgi:hypothetical protein